MVAKLIPIYSKNFPLLILQFHRFIPTATMVSNISKKGFVYLGYKNDSDLTNEKSQRQRILLNKSDRKDDL